MQKTIREWLEELPEPYRTQAIENGERLNGNRATAVMNERAYQASLSGAINGAFVWRFSPQGSEYWKDIYNRAVRGEFDK